MTFSKAKREFNIRYYLCVLIEFSSDRLALFQVLRTYLTS